MIMSAIINRLALKRACLSVLTLCILHIGKHIGVYNYTCMLTPNIPFFSLHGMEEENVANR